MPSSSPRQAVRLHVFPHANYLGEPCQVRSFHAKYVLSMPKSRQAVRPSGPGMAFPNISVLIVDNRENRTLTERSMHTHLPYTHACIQSYSMRSHAYSQ
jgi:hypothetical protein